MGAFDYRGFGSRRKRNLQLSGASGGPILHDDLVDDDIVEEEIDITEVAEVENHREWTSTVRLPSSPSLLPITKKLTIYVDQEWLGKITQLKTNGQIPSYSWLINELLKQALGK